MSTDAWVCTAGHGNKADLVGALRVGGVRLVGTFATGLAFVGLAFLQQRGHRFSVTSGAQHGRGDGLTALTCACRTGSSPWSGAYFR